VSQKEIEEIRKEVFEDKELVKRFKELKNVKVIPKLLESKELKKVSSGAFYHVEIEERSSEEILFIDKLCVRIGKKFIIIEDNSASNKMPLFLSTIKSSFKIKTEKDAEIFEKALYTIYPISDRKGTSLKKNGNKWIFVGGQFFEKLKGFVVEISATGTVTGIEYAFDIDESISKQKKSPQKNPVKKDSSMKDVLSWLKKVNSKAFKDMKVEDLKSIKSVEINFVEVSDLSHLEKLNALTKLALNGKEITDLLLKGLLPLKSLKRLELRSTGITDAGLENLSSLTSLYFLSLQQSANVTDAGLKKLNSLKSLTSLNLWGTKITDNGVMELASSFKSLKNLVLLDTNITDSCVKDLSKLTSLEYLCVKRTKLSDKAVKKIKKALPKCEIAK